MSEFIKEIMSEEEFYETVSGANTPVLVDFWATWCNPCKMQTPILEELAEELKDKITVLKVDVDQNEKLAYELKIRSIPALFLYKDGDLVEKTIGLTSKAQLSEMIIKYL